MMMCDESDYSAGKEAQDFHATAGPGELYTTQTEPVALNVQEMNASVKHKCSRNEH